MKILLLIFLLVLSELGYFRIAEKYNIVDKPNERSSHKKVVLRGGGVIFAVGVLFWFFLEGRCYPWFVLGMTIVSVVSFWDDVHSLPDSVRLVVQFVAMTLMFADIGILQWNMWWIVALALLLCVGITNAFNFMDGINGMTGGYSLTVLLPLSFLNYKLNFVDENLIFITMLASIVFCFFNFRKCARCFAGDVGAIGVAFVIIFLLGKLIMETGDFTYIVLLVVYGVDSIMTILHRIRLRENLGIAHRKHAYQLLANELKLPHVMVSSLYMGLQLSISAGILLIPNTMGWHWVYLGVTLLLLVVSYVMFMKKYYHLHEEYLTLLKQ